jgi:hypothetical protein
MAGHRSYAILLLAIGLLRLPSAPVAAAAAGDPAPPPACDRSVNPCERLSWVEQKVWQRDKLSLPAIRKVVAEDAHERVRERGIGALVILGDASAADLIADRLAKDPSPAVRRAAAEGIGLLRAKVLPARLVEPLQKDPFPLVRAECARAIGRIGMKQGAPQLMISLMQDPSPEVRALAGEAISLLRIPEGYETLRFAALQDTAPIVRFYALQGLVDSAPGLSYGVFKEVFDTTSDAELKVEAFRGLLAARGPDEWRNVGLADPDRRIRFLAFREWIIRLPSYPEMGYPPVSEVIAQMEPFLGDPLRGIRDLAKARLEKFGVKVRQSGFTYAIEK